MFIHLNLNVLLNSVAQCNNRGVNDVMRIVMTFVKAHHYLETGSQCKLLDSLMMTSRSTDSLVDSTLELLGNFVTWTTDIQSHNKLRRPARMI